MASYSNQVAIVTGAGGGLGRALCLRLAQLGARVHGADCDLPAAQETIRAIQALGRAATVHHVDVSDGAQVENLLRIVAESEGRIDLLVNNAGVGSWGPLEHVTPQQWRTAIDVNLWGTIHGTAAAYRIMLRQGSGRIVNVASAAGLLPVPGTVPYATAKHAVVGLSTSLRAEAAARGIRVNVVCQGPVRSDGFFRSLLLSPRHTAARQAPRGAIPVEQAVDAIFRGIERDRSVIVFPARARLLWWAYRLWPGSLNRMHSRLVRNLHDAVARSESAGGGESSLPVRDKVQ